MSKMDLSTKNYFDYDMPSIDEDTTETVRVLEEENLVKNEIVTVVIIVVLVVLTIGLLFGMAIFIDCRHKKRAENGESNQRRSLFNIKMPSFFKFRRFSNEEESYARNDSDVI